MPAPRRLPLLAVAALLLSACGGEGGTDPGGGATVCSPSATRPCYTGPVGTEDVGPCHAGAETCAADGSGWGGCVGERVPAADVCGNGVDEDCDGSPDDSADEDMDSWSRCGGDCCDTAADGCPAPAAVNPGAYDVPGNALDDDCSGGVDDAVTSCAPEAVTSGVTGLQLAQALDLCQSTTLNPPLAQRRWGVISARLLKADGSGAPTGDQVGVLADLGPNNVPRSQATFAVLSTGTARDPADPGHVSPFTGHSTANSSSAPGDYLAAHAGGLPARVGCPSPSTTVNDPVMLELRLRVPTNAQGFRYWFRFFSSEYWEWVCTQYNDAFVALLDSAVAGIPGDKNLSFDALANPVSVNTGFFDSCASAATPIGTYACPYGTADLQGSGYLLPSATTAPDKGGATSWLRTTAPVLPGETITLRYVIWDAGDHLSDSLVLLDGFEWVFEPASVGTTP